jgi:general secretion pathway protein B
LPGLAPEFPSEPARAAAKPKSKAPLPAQPSASTPGSTSSEARIYRYNELPDNIRQELPSLTLGGSMYSETQANRMLIVNGQVFHESDTLAPGVVLEQIKLKEVILTFKGYRYGVRY